MFSKLLPYRLNLIVLCHPPDVINHFVAQLFRLQHFDRGPESQQSLLEVEGRDQSVSVDGVGVIRFLLDLLLGAVERQGFEIILEYQVFECHFW